MKNILLVTLLLKLFSEWRLQCELDIPRYMKPNRHVAGRKLANLFWTLETISSCKIQDMFTIILTKLVEPSEKFVT